MNSNVIKAFRVKGLWGEKDLLWENIHPDMNILVGINGSGKSNLALAIFDIIIHSNYICYIF